MIRLSKFYISIYLVCFAGSIYCQQNMISNDELKKDVEWIGTCQTEVIEKAELKGLNTLNLQEKIKYYIDTFRCEYKNEAKRIHRHIDQKQLKEDAIKSGIFYGKSGSITYGTIALLLYITLT